MIKFSIVLVLTLFQDNYVRLGTLFGITMGFWGPEILRGETNMSIFTFGYIGWGLGVYISNYRKLGKNSSLKKFRVFQGRR